jgi:RNA polymerase-binding transcription factor DksA
VPVTPEPSQVPAAAGRADAEHLLGTLRSDLAAELEIVRSALAELRRQRSDRFDDDEHDPEGLPLSGEWSRLDQLRRSTERRITEVDAALANVRAGRYGVCLACGRPIPPGRLEARPTATLCVRCAAR